MQHWQCHTRGPAQYKYKLEDGDVDAVEEIKRSSFHSFLSEAVEEKRRRGEEDKKRRREEEKA